MKNLIILYGLPNGGKYSWESLNKVILNSGNYDLAVVIPQNLNLPRSILSKINYVWTLDESNNFINFCKKNNYQDAYTKLNRNIDTGLFPSGLISFISKDIVLNEYENLNNKYDYLLFTRFDNYFLFNNLEFQGENLWIVKGEDYGGINDRFVAVHHSLIKKSFNIMSYINQPTTNVDGLNCEQVWLEYLKDQKLVKKIYRFDRSFFLIANKSDKTNWRKAIYKLYLFKDSFIKYPDEFIEASYNFINKYGKLLFIFSKFPISVNYYYLTLRRFLGSIKAKYE